MRNVVQDLRVEHTSMERLLKILEKQIEVFEAGGQPDYGIIRDIVLFFLDFPDQCHHPKEDSLAQKLLSRCHAQNRNPVINWPEDNLPESGEAQVFLKKC